MSRYVHSSQVRGHVVLADVTVVDPVAGTAQAGRDVFVEDGRITAVTAAGAAREGAAAVDGRGRYLTPGFVDAHAHALNTPHDVDGAYALMLAAGVTGFRQMSGNDALVSAAREGRLPAPTGAPALLATPGDLLTPANARTVAAALATVRHQHAVGADFIKAGFVSREPFLAVLDEARRLGIPVAGHLPGDVDPREAARGGMRVIEHLGPGVTVFAATCSCEDEVRASTKGRSLPPIPTWLPGVTRLMNAAVARMVTNPAATTSPGEAAAYTRADATYDEAKAAALARLFVEHQTWQCPTLIRNHTMQFGDDPIHTRDPRRRWMAADVLERWDASAKRLGTLPHATRESLRAHMAGQLRLTRVFAEAGVPMLAGSDANGSAWVIPGFGLHDEFDLLATAGLDPVAILRMTTSEPARFLGLEDERGRVAPGFAADLVLLDSDPLADHRALHEIAGVMRAGEYWTRAELDGVLDRVEAHPGAR